MLLTSACTAAVAALYSTKDSDRDHFGVASFARMGSPHLRHIHYHLGGLDSLAVQRPCHGCRDVCSHDSARTAPSGDSGSVLVRSRSLSLSHTQCVNAVASSQPKASTGEFNLC